jgi:F-type H+-transporting ATPase subunit c
MVLVTCISLLGKTSLTSSQTPLNSILSQQRNAGTSVLGCAIALIGVGGCAQGMGQVLAALIVGIARNPSMKEDLFTYTMIVMGLLEVIALLIGLGAGLLYFSE